MVGGYTRGGIDPIKLKNVKNNHAGGFFQAKTNNYLGYETHGKKDKQLKKRKDRSLPVQSDPYAELVN
jgi:hypothetical protein